MHEPVDAVGAHGADLLGRARGAVAAHRVVAGAHRQRDRGAQRAVHAVRLRDLHDGGVRAGQRLYSGVEGAQVHVTQGRPRIRCPWAGLSAA